MYHLLGRWFDEGPSEGASNLGRRLKPPERQILLPLFLFFLIADVGSDGRLVQAHRAHAVPARPEVEACEIALPAQELTMNPHRRLPLQKSDRVGNAVLGRYAQAQVNVVGQSVTLDQFDLMLTTQFANYLPDLSPQLAEEHLLPVFRNEHQMVLAVPSNVSLALPFSHDGLLSLEMGFSKKETVSYSIS